MRKIVMFISCIVSYQSLLYAVDIMVSIPPQKYFVKIIVGSKNSVQSIINENDNPETYQISARNLRMLESSKVFFTIGVPYERALVKSLREKNARGFLIADMGKGVKRRFFTESEEHEHNHDHHDHEYGENEEKFDPHIWLSISNAPILARTIYQTLIVAYPQNKDIYAAGYKTIIEKIQKLSDDVQAMIEPYRGKEFVIYHPALGYLADDCRLKQIAIQWKGLESSSKRIRTIINQAQSFGIKTVFIQEGFPKRAAKTIAQKLKGSVVVLNPLATNWIRNMKSIVQALVDSFQ